MERFGSKLFFMAMMLIMCIPAPIIAYCKRYDEVFDEALGTSHAYYFRIVFLQGSMAVIIALWMFMPQTPGLVLFVGVCLSTKFWCVCSAALQLISTLEAKNVSYLNLGMRTSGLLPIFVFAVLSFEPTDPLSVFRMALSPVLIMCLVAVAVLSYFHFVMGVFDKGYSRLSYTFGELDWSDTRSRQLTVTTPLLGNGGPYKGIPEWIVFWNIALTILCLTQAFVLSFTSFLGGPSRAQTLSLWKLAMDCAGTVLSIPVLEVPCFEAGPWHIVLASLMGIFGVASSLVISTVAYVEIPWAIVLFAWCLLHLLFNFINCLIEQTTCAYTAVAERKTVMEKQALWKYTGFTAGVLLAMVAALLAMPPQSAAEFRRDLFGRS
jgi:hypothetical protein